MGKRSNISLKDRIRSFAREQASERPQSFRRDTPSGQERPALSNAPSHPKPGPVTTQHASEKSSSSPPPGKPFQEILHGEHSASHSSSNEDTKENSQEDTALAKPKKPGLGSRIKAGSLRFLNHTKNALFRSWINVLLVFIPVGIALNWVNISDPTTHATVVFSLNAVAIIPLAGLLSHATESVASRMGDTWASLLNVTFGNAVELIIFIIALVKNEITIVQASILGSILANLLLILGMSFLFGGLRFREQLYNSTVTQMSACLLSLSVSSLLLPTAFHATFADNALANQATIKISRGTSVILLLVYVLYLLFQLKSHAYMYESTPQQIIDEESHPGVLAEMLNSSSSSDDSNDSSDESSTSSGSNKRGQRIKNLLKGRRRRKSNASSAMSSFGSPTDKRSVAEGTLQSNQESYFGLDEHQRRETQTGGTSGNLPFTLMSGDEADTDGEVDPGAPRVRDFSVGQTSPRISPSPLPIVKAKSKSKKKSKKHRHNLDEKDEHVKQPNVNAQPSGNTAQPKEVNFSPVSETKVNPAVVPSRRPFTARQLSRVVPPLPPVFVAAPKPQAGTGAFTGHPMAMARSGLHRTSSLPDRLHMNRQSSQAQPQQDQQHRGLTAAQSEPVRMQRTGTPAINEPDALRKHNDEEEEPHMSRTAAVVLLLISTGLVAFCAELLVDAIPQMIDGTNVSQAFIGLIILPIVGNAAEHVTAVTVAAKNKMDLAIGVAVGSSIQIALFVTPFIVLLGWILDKPMSLYFNLFDTVSLFVTAFVVNFLVLDGRSNYLEGALLIAAYIIIAVAAFFYPATADQSDVGGAGGIGA